MEETTVQIQEAEKFGKSVAIAVSTLIDVAIASIFFYAAAAHLQNLFRLLETILAYKLFPVAITHAITQFVPFIEIGLGCGLLFRNSRSTCRKWAIGLLLFFFVAQLSVLARGIEVDCGCFGGLINRNVGWKSISLDVVMIALLISSTVLSGRRPAQNSVQVMRNPLCKIMVLIVLSQAGVHQHSAFGDELLDAVPLNSRFIVRINNVRAFAKTADDIVRQFLDMEQTQAVLTDKPSPVLSSTSMVKLRSLIGSVIEVSGEIDSITVFEIRGDHGSSRSVCVIKHQPDFSAKMRELLDDAQDLYDLIEEESGNDQGSSGGERESTQAEEATPPLLASWKFKTASELIFISSDEATIQRVLDRIGNPNHAKESLVEDRRFERVSRALKFDEADAFVYFDPRWIVPWLLPTFDQLDMTKVGTDEIVSGGIRLDAITTNFGHSFRADGCLKFTFPVQGITENWESYKPITEIPPIVFSPTKLRIVNRDNKKYHETMGDAFDRIHGDGEYRKMMDKKWTHVGGFDIARASSDGRETELWFMIPNGQIAHLRFRGVLDPQSSQIYQENIRRFMGEGEPSFPYEREFLDGSPGWFLSDETARKKYENDSEGNDPKDVSSHAFNTGVVITPQFSIEGDKIIVQRFLELSSTESTDAANELDRVFPGAKELVVQLRPHFVELKWPAELRRHFFNAWTLDYLNRKFKDDAKVLDVILALTEKEITHIPIDTRYDRLFVAFEMLSKTWIKNFGRLAIGVGKSDDGLRFMAQTFSDSAEEAIISIDGYDNYTPRTSPKNK